MAVTCEHCKKEISSKNDLIVMPQWWIIPKPLHKACWGNLTVSRAGVGSVSYGTGVFSGRNRMKIAVNSAFFSVIAVIFLVLSFVVLTMDFSGATVTSDGVERAPSEGETILFKSIISLLLLIPLLIRVWSFTSIESRF